MFVLVLLGVAAIGKSGPVKPSKVATEDATQMPELHLAYLVEDVDYLPSHLQKLQQKILRSGKKFGIKNRLLTEEKNEIEDGYGRRRRSTVDEDLEISQLLNGRRSRSPQDTNTEVLTDANDDNKTTNTKSTGVSALAIANILKAAGAKPQPIDRSPGYGRKRRSPKDISSNESDSLKNSEVLQSSSPSGGSDERRKRSPQKEPAHVNAHQYGMVDSIDESSVTVKPHGKYGDLQRILALSGAKPQPISRGVSYGRKKRSPEDISNEIITNEIPSGPGLVKKVAIEAVKVKSRGNYGNIAQEYDAGTGKYNVVFNGRYGRRKREDFIPFNVYDKRRVQTLKIEQNDFLALPNRLQIEKQNSERNVKKRHFPPSQ